MEFPTGGPPPRPMPRQRRAVSPNPPQPSQLTQPSPLSQTSLPSRPGVLVQATQPFHTHDPEGMIKFLLENRIGVEQVREVVVPEDRMKAYVEFNHPEVIPWLLSNCNDLQDPSSQQPFLVSSIDLMTVWPPYIVVTGFPPFVSDQMIKQHFESMASNQEVQFVDISSKKQSATIMYTNSSVAFDVVSSKTQIFGSDLHMELCYYGPNPAEPAPASATADSQANTLCVQGIPVSMLNDTNVVSEALKYFLKQTTGFEATHCQIVDGVGYLKFVDPSAAQEIAANPPKTPFMAGSVLHMSVTLLGQSPQTRQPETSQTDGGYPPTQDLRGDQLAPPTNIGPPKQAWGPTSGGPSQSSPSANRERPSTAPVGQVTRPPIARRRRNVSDDKDNGHMHPEFGGQVIGNVGGSQNQWSQNPFSQQPNPQSSIGQVPHSASSPGGLGATQTQCGQQLPGQYHAPVPAQRRTHHRQTQSANNQLGGYQPMQSGSSLPFSDSQSTFQQISVGQMAGNQYMAGYPPTGSGFEVPRKSGNCIKILVTNFPTTTEKFVLECYFKALVAPVQLGNIAKRGNHAIVTFNSPLEFQTIHEKMRQMPFEGSALTVSLLQPSSKVLISQLNDSISEAALRYTLISHTGDFNSVIEVKKVSLTNALATFNSSESAQKTISKSPLQFEGATLFFEEFYDFMDANETDFAVSNRAGRPLPDKHPQHVWNPQKVQLTKEEHFYLEQSLSELNDKLLPLKASAEIEGRGKSLSIVISPLDGVSAIDDWKDRVTDVRTKHFEDLLIETIRFPKEARADVQDYVYDNSDTILVVKREKQSLVIAGRKEAIAKACEEIVEICLEHEITTRPIAISRKHVKYLQKFCRNEFKKLEPAVSDIQFNLDAESIIATANPNGHDAVDRLIEQAREAINEKNTVLSAPAFKLLSSQRGGRKLNEIISVSSTQLVYDLEQYQDPTDNSLRYRICFLSKNKEILKTVKQAVLLYIHEEKFSTTAVKIRVCSSKEWRDFVLTICEEHFVSVTAQEASSTIVVTGEQLVCRDIVQKVKKFLEKHTNIEERVVVNQSEWYIINSNFSNELKGINEQANMKQVKVEWPKKANSSSLSIVISGEPGVVDDVKVQIEMLKTKVCKKETRVAGVPAVVHVLESMEDKIRLLETDEKVRVEVNLENGENEGAAASQTVGEIPRQVCSGTSPNGCRVSVYTGDSTQNAPVGVIINFITPSSDPQIGHLKHLLESGGPDASEDFVRKFSQFIDLKPGDFFKTRPDQLRCSQLIHCVLPSWKNQSESDANKEYFLEDALNHAIRDASVSGSMLVTPPSASPLHYPANVFARLVMDAVVDQAAANLHVSIYVEELQHAKEFESALQTRNYQIHTKVPLSLPLLSGNKKKQEATTTSAKTITSNLGSFITVVNGDLLQAQAEVYINSTNTSLNLKQGQLSKLLLNACGDDLQKECSEYAPLKPGHVAVTDAKNLKCNHIFHVALPEYKTANSERMFRETVKQILRIAKSMSVSSIAIPSLGVANLGFPENVSARILFQEVIAFHAQFPRSDQKFIFVIFEKSAYQAFCKEFAQQMSGESQAPVSQDPSPAAQPTPSSQPTGSTLLTIAQGNIAEEKSDIIVNTTSEDMALNKSAVSKAIAEKAGEELQKTCRQLYENGMRLEHGQLVVTPAFGKLCCKKIIHAHIPHRGSMANSYTRHSHLIGKIVTDSLQKAESIGMQSISFPAFGLGGGGYLVEQIAEPMLKAFQKFGQTHPTSVKSIRVVIYDSETYKKFNEFYCKFFGRSSSDPTPPQGFLSRFLGSSQKPDNSQELQTSASASYSSASTVPPLWALSRSVPNPIAVFQIFAASDAQCNKIEKKLRELISEKSCTKEIKGSDVIDQLIEDDFCDIVQTGDKLGVQVKVLPKLKEIRISGEKSKVMEALGEIQKILSDIERSRADLPFFEWQSEDADGIFEPYPQEANVRLERANIRQAKAIELIVDGVAVVIDLQNNTETDKTTGKIRKIRRAKKTMPSFDFPPTWMSTEQSAKKSSGNMQMFEVPQGSQEYDDAVEEFEESFVKWNIKYSIEKVERIENRIEYTKHMALYGSIKEKYGKGDVLVKRLFHGSRIESIQAIAVQGFNRNFAADANAAYFGKGVYFAVEAGYSAQDKYSVADTSGLRYMFVCRVIIGKYTKGSNNLKTAPPLKAGSQEVFDTLVDNDAKPTIFVAMSDAQAYPEYLITFKKTK